METVQTLEVFTSELQGLVAVYEKAFSNNETLLLVTASSCEPTAWEKLTREKAAEKQRYLVLQIFDFFIIAAVVPGLTKGALLGVPLPDPALQVSVFLFQASHLVQVRSQAVVKVLHGDLFVTRKKNAITSKTTSTYPSTKPDPKATSHATAKASAATAESHA